MQVVQLSSSTAANLSPAIELVEVMPGFYQGIDLSPSDLAEIVHIAYGEYAPVVDLPTIVDISIPCKPTVKSSIPFLVGCFGGLLATALLTFSLPTFNPSSPSCDYSNPQSASCADEELSQRPQQPATDEDCPDGYLYGDTGAGCYHPH